MRDLLLAIFCAMTLQSFSQDFEGTITWSMKTEFTDPARKAEMAENMRTAQDQITYAKLKAMAVQNDPQYKKMMEDPKMKAEMEKAMQMQTPTMNGLTLTVKIKNQNMLSKMPSNESLFLKEKNQTYIIDREKKTYSRIPQRSTAQDPKAKVNVIKAEENDTILGFLCKKYIVESSENGTKMTRNIWTTTEIKDLDIKDILNQNRGAGGPQWYFDNIEGFPLKFQVRTTETLFTMEIITMEKASLPDSDFIIPDDFKEVKFGRGY
jgi:hypothetical protein